MSPYDVLRNRKLVLASGSRPRADVLRRLGVDFVQAPTNAAEDLDKSPYAGRPQDYCDATCALKLDALTEPQADTIYIVADTIVVCREQILEKPRDRSQAKDMLMMYSDTGQAEIYTAMAVKYVAGKEGGGVVARRRGQSTTVHFRKFGEKEVDEYLENNYAECKEGCGALCILGSSTRWISSIQGCMHNAAGLSPSTFFDLLTGLPGQN